METYSNFWTRQILLFLLLLLAGSPALARSWMPGYNFRKKITIDKSKVSGTASLLNFPVLIVVQDAELRYIGNCEGRLKNSKGLDISFAATNAPQLPLAFQLDHYDAVNGKLVCWVNIQELFTGSNPGQNEIYLYYGSTYIHDPFTLSARATWPASYQQVWHLNLDAAPSISRSANHGPERSLTGSPGTGPANFPAACIGDGLLLNGSTDGMAAAADTNTTVCITAWIKMDHGGTEQVILASDTTAGGYVIKVNPQGNLVFETKNAEGFRSATTTEVLAVNTWYNLACIFIKGIRRIYINGVYKAGGGSNGIKLGRAGALSIGKSKQNGSYFKGTIDELRIQNIERNVDWISTEYRNQANPASFISVAAEEVNPANVPLVNEFTGAAGTEAWLDEGNWSLGALPAQNAQVIIKGGKKTKLSVPALTMINQLILEPRAILHLESGLEVNCAASIAANAAVVLEDGARLTFKYDVLNNGRIGLNKDHGSLVFRGGHALQTLSGAGSVTVSRLEVELASATHTLLLQSPLSVGKQVQLNTGTLNSNGNLSLLADTSNYSAALMPVTDPVNTQLTGDVQVQHFVKGNFAAPSTARGWWLLAAPVYQSELNGQPQNNFAAIKASVFVTGTGGTLNGFDASPNNGGTIYTHDQSLPGSLSQKYKAIPNMNVSIPSGKGFYLFSRGSRNVSDAYLHQIQTPPFSNPGPYTITYTGKLYTGDLTVNLFNRNSGAEGDGFNLLGNPYASALRWAALQKHNVSPFLWVFNTQNNAYQVTDDPDYIIPSGTGFFVRVNSGTTTGSLIFQETAKYTGTTAPATQMALRESRRAKETASRVKIQLYAAGLTDSYTLIFSSKGNDGINDADAAKIGEGYLGIAGIAGNGTKLSIDERAMDTIRKEVCLYVKGWASGNYTLNLKTLLKPNEEIVLADRYLGISKRLTEPESNCHFFIDTAIPASYGQQRFAILYRELPEVKQKDTETDKNIVVYPNPFKEWLYLKSARLTYKNLKVLIRDVTGRVVWSNVLPILDAGIPIQQWCGQLVKGIYFLQLLNPKNNKVEAVFKVLRN